MSIHSEVRYTVTVRGTAHPFAGLERAATFAAARRLEGETDIAYSVVGFAEALRNQQEAALIAKVEELLALHSKTL
jgi:hypothetical protein